MSPEIHFDSGEYDKLEEFLKSHGRHLKGDPYLITVDEQEHLVVLTENSLVAINLSTLGRIASASEAVTHFTKKKRPIIPYTGEITPELTVREIFLPGEGEAVTNKLGRHGITKVSQVLGILDDPKGEEKLLAIPTFGQRSLEIIRQKLGRK